MAWERTSRGLEFVDPETGLLMVSWTCQDTVDNTIKKNGAFEFQLTEDGWTADDAAIDVKIANGDGAIE